MREHWQTLSAARRAGTLLGLAGLAGGWAAGMPALGLALLAICWWTAEPVPVDYSSLLILVLIPAFGLLTLPQTLAPFAGSAVWLIFAGMVLSLGITATGLEAHLAGLALRRLGRSPGLLLLQLHLLGLAAAFLVPSGRYGCSYSSPSALPSSMVWAAATTPGSTPRCCSRWCAAPITVARDC